MEKPGIVITGASGRMGQMLVRTVLASDQARLVGVIERPGNPWIGRDLGEAMGGAPVGVIATDDAVEAIATAQAVIDFTTPKATVAFAELAAQARAVHVIGTTGLEPGDLAKIKAAARHAPIIRAGNMSLGVNLLVGLTRKVAAALGEDWDIEVVEAHHSRKVDAPSGTARHTAHAIAAARAEAGVASSPDATETGWEARGADVDGVRVHAVRLRGLVAHEEILFGNTGEQLSIRQDSFDRVSFMPGVLLAVREVVSRPGLTVGLENVLDLS